MSVGEYYDQNPQEEWDRLGRHKIELAVTMRTFAEYFPSPPAVILDVGGGPGRYSIALAQKNYTVTLMDISQKSLEFAREKAQEAGVEVAGYVHGNALTLPFPEGMFDIILLMGPLYHLHTTEDREKALHEAARVLKRGGLICASFVTRCAPIRWAAKYEPTWVRYSHEQLEQVLTKGVASPLGRVSFLDHAYFAHPSEVIPFMEKADLEHVDLVACEGVISMIDEQVNELGGELWEAWVDVNYRLGKDPTVQGAAEHLLYVGRKK